MNDRSQVMVVEGTTENGFASCIVDSDVLFGFLVGWDPIRFVENCEKTLALNDISHFELPKSKVRRQGKLVEAVDVVGVLFGHLVSSRC
jgi:hypothetical protein